METKEQEVTERLEAAATLLERALSWLEERQKALEGDVEKISATVEQTRREEELSAKLAEAEALIVELKAAGASQQTAPSGGGAQVLASLRRTLPASAVEMLAKNGVGEGTLEPGKLDAALAGLSMEQRIAVKTKLRHAGSF